MSVYYVQYSWIYMYYKHQNNMSYVSILCTRGFICTINIKTKCHMSVTYVLVDLYVSILCTRGFTCTINIKTICQYLMYSWIYMYNKHQSNMSVSYVLVDLHVQ
jgi:putative flippase GtrA